MKTKELLSLDDFEHAARNILPHALFSYVEGGAETNNSLLQNRKAFQRYAFVPRIMRNVSSVSTSASLWGEQFQAPIGIAPMGLSALTAYQGDLIQAQAAAKANIPMIMSGSSLIPLEKIAP